MPPAQPGHSRAKPSYFHHTAILARPHPPIGVRESSCGPAQRLAAEALGTALLVATVVGSGIMAESLSGGNTGVALRTNTIATGAILFLLITAFGPVSGTHFNPVVTAIFALRREFTVTTTLGFVAVQTQAAAPEGDRRVVFPVLGAALTGRS